MPTLLLREASTTSLSALVEKAQKKASPSLEYDLLVNDGLLELILFSKKPERKINSTSTDEGFESDIDSLSIVSSDNDSFTTEKLLENSSKPNTETDSANGSSSSDSDTDAADSKTSGADTIDGGVKNAGMPKESYNLVDCVCYTDVKCTDILIFVIRNEAFVFKFDNINHLQTFYTNFSTLKAIANQKAYTNKFATKFNLLQRTDQNGVTHIEITREAEQRPAKDRNESSVISINAPEDAFEKFVKNRTKDVNSRQRAESQLINDIKYNTINSKLGPRTKIITKSNSIENILDLDQQNSHLVKREGTLEKIWNSADDLLDPPKRPVRRKKGKAPPPPVQDKQDVLSGQYVRVNVNFDPIKDFDKNRLVIKSSLNEPHPKKLQNFNILSTARPSLPSFLKSKDKQVLKYEPRQLETGTLNRNKPVFDSNWTNSVPRLLKKPKGKTESKNFVPMAYRYIDTTQDYPANYGAKSSGHFTKTPLMAYGHNLALSNYLQSGNQNINNRLFGLSPKLRDFSSNEDTKWAESNVIVTKDNNLKSVIKNSKDDLSKKKNDKKVTFSAYTTVQVV